MASLELLDPCSIDKDLGSHSSVYDTSPGNSDRRPSLLDGNPSSRLSVVGCTRLVVCCCWVLRLSSVSGDKVDVLGDEESSVGVIRPNWPFDPFSRRLRDFTASGFCDA